LKHSVELRELLSLDQLRCAYHASPDDVFHEELIQAISTIVSITDILPDAGNGRGVRVPSPEATLIVIAVVARRDFSLDSFLFIPYSRLMLFHYLILSLEITFTSFIPPFSTPKKTRHTMIAFLNTRTTRGLPYSSGEDPNRSLFEVFHNSSYSSQLHTSYHWGQGVLETSENI
jgi:hypothetical protein